jgi:hexosaminidase
MLPLPISGEWLHGRFTLTPDVVLQADAAALPAAQLLAEYLETALGTAPQISRTRGTIILRTAVLGSPEAYELYVGEHSAELTGGAAGLLHAVQALRQLLPPEALSPDAHRTEWQIPQVKIVDAPRLAWRGLMLDVARNFTPVPGILRLLDLMALHRLNVLQLHLTDDQGWRLEIGKYPLLTEIGGRRPAAAPDPDDPRCRATGPAQEGWYSKADISNIVQYAERRGITVVPEIELPGHVQAALAAYPHLGNGPAPLGVWDRWGINTRTLNAEPETVDFFKNVLDEVLEAFPSPYVHLGGDECPSEEWHASPVALARTRALGLHDPAQLHGWLMRTLADHVISRGRRPIGWDEVAASLIPGDITVMSWHGASTAEAAAERGFDVILAPWEETYFDLHQAHSGEPRAQKGVLTLADAYAFTPHAARFAQDLAPRLLGAQCQLWTEYIPTQAHLDYMAFPRVAAFAERAWGAPATYQDFLTRLTSHLHRLRTLGVGYRPPTGPDHATKAGPG